MVYQIKINLNFYMKQVIKVLKFMLIIALAKTIFMKKSKIITQISINFLNILKLNIS